MSDLKWIGPFEGENYPVGHIAFLIRHAHVLKGWDRYELRDTAAKTNQSFQDRLTGWCGSYNDVSTYAEGVVQVSKIAKNGRLQVREVKGAELATYLDEMGYPELIPC